MQINRSDVIWNYAATFLKIAASSLLLPFILKLMPSETVGIWSVFVAVNALNSIFDFGFNPAFTRSITYIFSGISKLEVQGFSIIKDKTGTIDYGLLKGVISAMKWFYARTSAIYFLLLSTLGTYYIHTLLKNYHSSHYQYCSYNKVNQLTYNYNLL